MTKLRNCEQGFNKPIVEN